MSTKAFLLAHLQELHPGSLDRPLAVIQGQRLTQRSTFAELSRAHQLIHHRLYCGHYHAGPNRGVGERPPGWKTGKDVVMKPRGES